MNKYILSLIFIFSLAITSCDMKDDFEQINSQVVNAAGEWWIKFQSPDGLQTGFLKVLTYNTADDVATEMWISDKGNWMNVQCKCPVDVNALTFGGTNLANIKDSNSVNISDGKITLNGATSTSGVVTDAISFKIELSSEPGVIYQAEGHRKTGFIEDEH